MEEAGLNRLVQLQRVAHSNTSEVHGHAISPASPPSRPPAVSPVVDL